ncbi:hypothetical protein Tco_1050793 [Tanacetum coccineum]
MIEPEVPLKKKGQLRINEELARKIEAEEQEAARIEIEEDEKLEQANLALIVSWDNVQAMMEADRLLAERIQAREQGELQMSKKQNYLLFDREIKRVNSFVAMDSEAEESSRKKDDNSSKRAREAL